MQTLAVNLTSNVRRERMGGRTYLVGKATLIVPGVLNGSDGPILYTAQENRKRADAWNGMPIVLRHPTDKDGTPVSARSPSAMDRVGLGFVFGSHVDNQGLLHAEPWFDEANLQAKDRRTYDRLLRGERVELSTGLGMQRRRAQNGATHTDGRAYTFTAHDYEPDHLAILPDQRGACSVQDGCGVSLNAANAFCPTGKGGGQDNSCSPKGGGVGGDDDDGLELDVGPELERLKEQRDLQRRADELEFDTSDPEDKDWLKGGSKDRKTWYNAVANGQWVTTDDGNRLYLEGGKLSTKPGKGGEEIETKGKDDKDDEDKQSRLKKVRGEIGETVKAAKEGKKSRHETGGKGSTFESVQKEFTDRIAKSKGDLASLKRKAGIKDEDKSGGLMGRTADAIDSAASKLWDHIKSVGKEVISGPSKKLGKTGKHGGKLERKRGPWRDFFRRLGVNSDQLFCPTLNDCGPDMDGDEECECEDGGVQCAKCQGKAANAFCPTGKGGGQDNSCSSRDGGSGGEGSAGASAIKASSTASQASKKVGFAKYPGGKERPEDDLKRLEKLIKKAETGRGQDKIDAHLDARVIHAGLGDWHEEQGQMEAAKAHQTAERFHLKAAGEVRNAGAYGNPQSTVTGKYKRFGSGTGKGDQHEAAQRGAMQCTLTDHARGADAKAQAEAGHNPPNWAVDEAKWERAKAAADKGDYDKDSGQYWAVVAHIYDQMGGTIKGKTKNQLGSQPKEANMPVDRDTAIGWLTANCDCWKGGADTLNELTDEQLESIVNTHNGNAALDLIRPVLGLPAEAHRVPAYVVNAFPPRKKAAQAPAEGEMPEEEEVPEEEMPAEEEEAPAEPEGKKPDGGMYEEEETTHKKRRPFMANDERGGSRKAPPTANTGQRQLTWNEWVRMAPPAGRAALNHLHDLEQARKESLAKRITANILDDMERGKRIKFLVENRDTEVLEEMAEYVPQPPEGANLFAEGPPTSTTTPLFYGAQGGATANAGRGEHVEPLLPPTINWAEESEKRRRRPA